MRCRTDPSPMTTTSPTFALTLPARAESLTVVRHVLGGITEAWPVHPELLDDVRIAVTEACSSAITHGPANGASGMLEVRGAESEGRLTVVVRSPSPGLSAPYDDDDLGLGLPLIGALTDELDIGRADDGSHEVRMVFPPSDG